MYSTVPYLAICTIACFTLSPLLLLSFALPLITTTTTAQCTPTSFQSVLLFFLTNYVAHTATVPSQAGAKWMASIPCNFGSLLYPVIGLLRLIMQLGLSAWAGSNRDGTLSRGGYGCCAIERLVSSHSWGSSSLCAFTTWVLYNPAKVGSLVEGTQWWALTLIITHPQSPKAKLKVTTVIPWNGFIVEYDKLLTNC